MALNYALWRHEEKDRRTEKKIDDMRTNFIFIKEEPSLKVIFFAVSVIL